MTNRSSYVALVSLTTMLACRAGGSHSAVTASTTPVVGREAFPRELAGFKRGDSTGYGDINSGISYRYDHSSGARVDIYRYPVAVGLVCRGECLRGIVDDEITGFKTDLPLYIRNGAMDSAEVVGAGQVDLPANSWIKVARRLELRVFRGGGWNNSYVWIFGGDGIRLKIRATHPIDEPDPDYRALINELVSEAAPPFTCARGPAGDAVIQIASRQKTDRQHLAKRILHALDSLGYQRSFVGPEMGHWAAAPRFGALQVGELRESELGIGLAVRITPVRDSIDFVVMGRTLCDGGRDPGALAMLAVVQFASVVTGNRQVQGR